MELVRRSEGKAPDAERELALGGWQPLVQGKGVCVWRLGGGIKQKRKQLARVLLQYSKTANATAITSLSFFNGRVRLIT